MTGGPRRIAAADRKNPPKAECFRGILLSAVRSAANGAPGPFSGNPAVRAGKPRPVCAAVYSFGPAVTSALPASLPSYLAKFLMKRPARSFAFSSHAEASA